MATRPAQPSKSSGHEACINRASQMCLPFAGSVESNGARSFAPKRSATVLMRTQTAEGLFVPGHKPMKVTIFPRTPTLSEAVFEAIHVAHSTAIHLW